MLKNIKKRKAAARATKAAAAADRVAAETATRKRLADARAREQREQERLARELADLLAQFQAYERQAREKANAAKPNPMPSKPRVSAHFVGVDVSDKVALKKAYRKAAAKLHPDVNKHPNATSQFRLLQDEYERLLNPAKAKTSATTNSPKAPSKSNDIKINGVSIDGVYAYDWKFRGYTFSRSTMAFCCGKCNKISSKQPVYDPALDNVVFARCNYCNTQNLFEYKGGLMTVNFGR